MSSEESKKDRVAQSVVLRNKIIDELIPKLEKAGKTQIVTTLYQAVEVGEDKVMEWPQYWELIYALAENSLKWNELSDIAKRINNHDKNIRK